MCIAIIAPAGCRVGHRHLVNSFNGNSDGAGIAFVNERGVSLSKGHMDLPSFIKAYDDLYTKFGNDNAMLLHCRIATAGAVTKSNCHPFLIKGGAMIHNGHLWSTGWESEKSDTREFAEIFYNILDYDSITKAASSLEEIIGWDKLGFLYDDGQWAKVGEWIEDEVTGVFFSNSGYMTGVGNNPNTDFNDDWDYANWWEKAQA